MIYQTFPWLPWGWVKRGMRGEWDWRKKVKVLLSILEKSWDWGSHTAIIPCTSDLILNWIDLNKYKGGKSVTVHLRTISGLSPLYFLADVTKRGVANVRMAIVTQSKKSQDMDTMGDKISHHIDQLYWFDIRHDLLLANILVCIVSLSATEHCFQNQFHPELLSSNCGILPIPLAASSLSLPPASCSYSEDIVA